jgi:hypothetical protein
MLLLLLRRAARSAEEEIEQALRLGRTRRGNGAEHRDPDQGRAGTAC